MKRPIEFRKFKNIKSASTALIISTAVCLSAYGDDYGPQDYSIVPPTPQVEALMDFKEYPVDYFNGIPQINFTLYTLTVGQIQVPITLSYHGGGIRVEQKAGNAGIGWTVNCGATISHTVYGAPDDAKCGSNRLNGLFHLSNDEKQFRKKLIEKRADYDPTDADNYRTNLSWEATLGNNYYLGRTDLANDLYNLYGQGMSATFAILPDVSASEEIQCVSDHPLKLVRNYIDVEGPSQIGCDAWAFTATTNDGVKYIFSSQDRTKYTYKHGSPELTQSEDSLYYASAWHLNSITDLSGNKVEFTYKEKSPLKIYYSRHAVERGYSNPDFAATSPSGSNGVTSTTYYPKVLTELKGSGIVVEFEYSFMNSLNRNPLLRTIVIKSPDGQTKKLVFSYTGGNFLSSIRDISNESDFAGELLYKFEYNQALLRELYYDEQDFGGYWNGIDNGYYMVPTKIFSCGQVGKGADRSVNPDYATERVLRRITYPTGGHTDFVWESNTFSHVKDREFYGRINSTKTIRVDTDTLRIVTREPEHTKLKISNWRLQPGQEAELDLTQYLAMNWTKYYYTAYWHDNSSKYPIYPEKVVPNYPHVVIRKSSNKEFVKAYYIDQPTVEPNGDKEVTKLFLEPGVYDFELVSPLAMDGADDDFENEFYYEGSNAGKIYLRRITTDGIRPAGNENWCGLRIKRITSCAGVEENDTIYKDYYYNLTTSPFETSGTVRKIPEYDYHYYESRPRIGIPGYESSEVYCVGESVFPQTTSGTMSAIEYPRVLVKMGSYLRDNAPTYLNTYRDSYIYSSSRDLNNCDFNSTEFLEYQPVGSRMYTSRSHRRGNLLKKNSNRAYAPYHVTEYNYNIYEKDDLPILTTDAFTVSDFSRTPGYNTYGGRDYGIGRYFLIPYNKNISSESLREEDGLHTIKKYNYFYSGYTDALDCNLVKSLSTTDSEQREVTTYYTYASGLNSYLPLPETEVSVCDGTVISAVRTEYDAVTKLPIAKYTLSDKVNPSELISSDQATTFRQKSVINQKTYEYSYNAKGNLIQISYKGRPLASYIWGYNGQYPIIEATGVDFETLKNEAKQSGLSESQIIGNSVSTDNTVTAVATQLREKLPKSNVTTISYHWLLGVARLTTPRGDSSSYSYDPRGRLVEVRDFNKYLINKFEYQYATSGDDEDFDY